MVVHYPPSRAAWTILRHEPLDYPWRATSASGAVNRPSAERAPRGWARSGRRAGRPGGGRKRRRAPKAVVERGEWEATRRRPGAGWVGSAHSRWIRRKTSSAFI